MFKINPVTRKLFTTFFVGLIAVFSSSAFAEDSCAKCNELQKSIKTWENIRTVYKKNLDDNNKLLKKIESNDKSKNKRNSTEEGQIRLNIINATALIETANNTFEYIQNNLKKLKCDECDKKSNKSH